jgi:hypothetical protein
MWQISYALLVKVSSKTKDIESSRSMHSKSSGPSTASTKFTFDSVRSSKNFNLFRLQDDLVIARKHQVRRVLNEENMAELRIMRQIDHENVNKFLGLSIDGPDFLSVWRFCSRGSLGEFINIRDQFVFRRYNWERKCEHRRILCLFFDPRFGWRSFFHSHKPTCLSRKIEIELLLNRR